MTRKKTRYRFRLIDFLIVLICLSVSGYFGYLFWKDLNSTTTRTDKDQIATIEFKQRIAQRKFSDRVVWERLQNKSPLYNGDTLRTAALSEATVTFNNKAEIEVHENTMIQIFFTEDGGVKVNVGGGDIEIDTSTVENSGARNVQPVISIQTGSGSVVNIQAGSKIAAATDSDTGIASFSLQEGFAEIQSENGDAPVVLEQGETAKVEHNGEVSKGSFTVTSISKNLRILNFEEEEKVPVQIEWKATEELKEKPVIIETSKTKDFTQIEEKYVVENQDNFTLPASDGVIYWRVSVDTQDEAPVEPVEGKIRVDNIELLTAVSPVDGASFGYRKELPKVNFNWKGNSLASLYRLEISKSPDFSSKVIETEITQTSAKFSSLEEGVYYWRVSPYYPINNTGYAEPSKVQSFSIVKNPELTVPLLSVPAKDAILTYQTKDFNVTFLWKSDVKTADYKVLIASDEKFSSIVYEKDIKDKRLFENFSEVLPVGSYYWKVVRQSEEDEGSSESEVRHFSVIKYVPGENRLLYPPENYSVEDLKLAGTNFMWKLADEYKNTDTESTIQISSDVDFKNIVAEAKTREQSYSNFKLKRGKYYWRIGVLNKFEDKLEFTKPRLLNVTSELGSAVITSPANGQEFVAMQNTPVYITWTEVPEADYYLVSVADSTVNKIIYEKTVSGTSVNDFVVPEKVSSGKVQYRVFVQAFTEQTDISSMRQGKTVSADFSVRSASPVKLISPESNVKIDGLSALRKPIVLEWASDGDKAVKSTIVLRKIQANGTAREIRRFDNRTSVNIDRLTSGNYEWTVYASTENGLPINAVENRRFTITEVPKLASPVLSEPKNNLVIGPDYLRKNRSITFSWKAVAGATDYTFTLNMRNKDGSIKKIYSEKNIKGTSVKFKQLEALDIGDFEWTVVPYCHAKDGYEEQNGKAGSSKFSIKFDLPSAVQTNDPGRVYGE